MLREESLLVFCFQSGGILLPQGGIRMTTKALFPQPVQPVWFEFGPSDRTQTEVCATKTFTRFLLARDSSRPPTGRTSRGIRRCSIADRRPTGLDGESGG